MAPFTINTRPHKAPPAEPATAAPRSGRPKGEQVLKQAYGRDSMAFANHRSPLLSPIRTPLDDALRPAPLPAARRPTR